MPPPPTGSRLPPVLALASFLGLVGLLRADGYRYPPRPFGDMTADLEVEVLDRAGTPPPPVRVRLTLRVEGPDTLEVGAPQLSDATEAWSSHPGRPKLDVRGNRANWQRTVELEQVKPGIVPLPSVKLRFRTGPAADRWEETEWTRILAETRDALPPEAAPLSPSRSRTVYGLGLGLLLVALLAGGGIWWRSRAREQRPLPSDRWALLELGRAERDPLTSTEYHTLLSNIVRRYLAERFRLPAPQQTTAEFLAAQVPELTAGQRGLLRDFFERCDLVKFARAETSPEERRHVADLARVFVEQTASAKKGEG